MASIIEIERTGMFRTAEEHRQNTGMDTESLLGKKIVVRQFR
jgi:hypothetical protein